MAFYLVIKRMLDVCAALLALGLGAPVWLLIGLLIKVDSPGGMFYCPRVVGKDGRFFSLYKFRTMRPGSDDGLHRAAVVSNLRDGVAPSADDKGPVYKTAHSDPSRVTRLGRFLRRTSLDEVPQFWNVIKGDMSLVGPRPALPYEAELYNEEQRRRFSVCPGITGLYQVTRRNRVSIAEMIEIDLCYVDTRSLWLDLSIIARTPFAMFGGR